MQTDTPQNDQTPQQNPYPQLSVQAQGTIQSPPKQNQIRQDDQPQYTQQPYAQGQPPQVYQGQPYINQQPYQGQPMGYQQQPYMQQPLPQQQYQQNQYAQQNVTIGQPLYYQQQQPYQQGFQGSNPNDIIIIAGPPSGPRQLPFDANMSPFPMEIICPKCNQRGVTVLHYELGSGTFMMSYLLFVLTGLCCCWLPCCMIDCQDKVHKCNHCHQEVGIRPYSVC